MKRLFILSVVLALMLGCATMKANPEGQLTTLPYDSEYDPNMFYDWPQNPYYPPQEVTITKTGEDAIIFFLLNPGDSGPSQALLALGMGGELLTYGWSEGEDWIVYELSEERTKYILFIPPAKEDKKSEGI